MGDLYTCDAYVCISEDIISYIKDGYCIDVEESIKKNKKCTFCVVLKRDVVGIECKTIIALEDNKNKTYTYHKKERVGKTKWKDEARVFSFDYDLGCYTFDNPEECYGRRRS